jgi:hypothetical protein
MHPQVSSGFEEQKVTVQAGLVDAGSNLSPSKEKAGKERPAISRFE